MTSNAPFSLAEALRRLPLLQPRQQEELPQLQDQFPEARELAGELIRRDWLTPYQANQLFRGRGRDLVLGSYILLGRLGEGGMGQVFKARHLRMGRIVAIKVIHRERLGKANAVRRFQREVRAAARLDHPNVVHAYDAGQAGSLHYFVMEYIEGIDLHRLVEQQGPLPAAQACEYVRQAALGLQHVHEMGLIHRDVKPHNLMRTPAERIKVLDVSLVRRTDPATDSSVAMTRKGAVLGTVDFLAPEQAADPGAADIRADLYSLGCTFYFLLSGRVPFPEGSLVEKLLKHQREEPAPLEQARPGLPPQVTAVVRRLMAKSAENRYPTAADLAMALEALPPLPPGAGAGFPPSALSSDGETEAETAE
jgi:serine/threonine protein kinase